MKKEDAEKLMCPFGPNHHFVSGFQMCISDGCMAWKDHHAMQRMHVVYNYMEDGAPIPERPKNVPPSWEWIAENEDSHGHWVEPMEEAINRVGGFCRLIDNAC